MQVHMDQQPHHLPRCLLLLDKKKLHAPISRELQQLQLQLRDACSPTLPSTSQVDQLCSHLNSAIISWRCVERRPSTCDRWRFPWFVQDNMRWSRCIFKLLSLARDVNVFISSAKLRFTGWQCPWPGRLQCLQPTAFPSIRASPQEVIVTHCQLSLA